MIFVIESPLARQSLWTFRGVGRDLFSRSPGDYFPPAKGLP